MMKKMKAYMIMDFNNPVSIAYSKKSIETFKPVQDLIEIIPIQCCVPADLEWIDNQDQWGNSPSLDPCVCGIPFTFYQDSKKRSCWSYTEISAFISHYRLWAKQAETPERFIVLEHDAYLKDEQQFRKLFKYLQEDDSLKHKPLYGLWNIGIAVECYSIARPLAEFIRHKITRAVDPWSTINMGPMGMLWVFSKYWRSIYPADGMKNKLINGEDAPVTQMYSPKLDITIDHGSDYKQNHYRNAPNLKIVDF